MSDSKREDGDGTPADEEPVPTTVSQNKEYDEEMPLDAREDKWGFTLAELQASVKVVSRLFRNPALFVGDPYLSDSRLYTMITRDRKTKRDNREIYKTIMNEEKSRRRRYQRMQDIEAMRRTAMKREREEALSALLLEGSPTTAQPLLLCERPTDVGNEETARQTRAADGELSDADKQLMRLAGAFENLLRLEQAYEGQFSVVAQTSVASEVEDAQAPRRKARKDTSDSMPSTSLHAATTTAAASTATPNGDATTTSAHTSRSVDWNTVTQLNAQVYRYIPHSFGSQMPPPLFPGVAIPADHTSVPAMWPCYIVGAKLAIARQASTLVTLTTSAGAAKVPTTTSPDTDPSRMTLPAALHTSADDIIVSELLPTLSDIDSLRAWLSETENGALADPSLSVQVLARTAADVLRGMEVVLLEGGHDARFTPLSPQRSTAHCEARSAATMHQIAHQSLNLFIARRLYQNSRVQGAGPSPVVVCGPPPTSDSQEPEEYCVYDDMQLYAGNVHEDLSELTMNKWIGCHTCKVRYRVLHPFYYSMCHLCGEYNYNKRLLARDLRGKVVLLTGCRIKIGYAMAVSLLRCGATLLGTTRFSHEALARFQQEPDYELWQDRLHLFSLDLRDMWMVTQFCAFVRQQYPKLFAIINNAAQTIARTPQYTEHLRHVEMSPPPELRAALMADPKAAEWHGFFLHHTSVTIGKALSIQCHPQQTFLPVDTHGDSEQADPSDSSAFAPTVVPAARRAPLTQHAESDDVASTTEGVSAPTVPASATTTTALASGTTPRTLIFDRYDTQAEESDTRETNSWVMKLSEVQGSEAAEVMAINALSPFIMNSKLKVCLLNRDGDAHPREARFIINVSAMEGQFYRFKQTTHPHTNMAKAALNMMTRTSADDYAEDGIYMNSVDTGWITDESPKMKKERRADQYMLCPLDEVDAAARCLDLIYTNNPIHGKFYKDYKEIPW